MSSSRILGRGVLLVATFDLICALIGICAASSQLYDISIWFPYSYTDGTSSRIDSNAVIALLRFVLFALLAINFFILIFGVFLIIGVRRERPGFLTAWLVPNMIWVCGVLVIGFIMAFTRFGVHAMIIFPGVVIFRAFEMWIIYEYHTELVENKYN